jgi:hypothetical protein
MITDDITNAVLQEADNDHDSNKNIEETVPA